MGAHPLFGPLSQRGLNPIKPVYDPDWPDGPLNLTASAFNQLGQYTSSPGRRGYCYAELTVFFPSGGRNHRQYSLHLPTDGWPGWVGLGGWLRKLPTGRLSPIPVLTGLDVEQLRWSRPTRYRYTKPPPYYSTVWGEKTIVRKTKMSIFVVIDHQMVMACPICSQMVPNWQQTEGVTNT